ncbi:S46 family peptidase [Paraferrimonas sedimenticola]|uniref:Dipeptidyl-peptidase n=1 Tax=Paraferrimonas sedimenticola TaxID=375674 RepID=A0AA37RTZ1_9GAMM|nr:S46 family peptidase [Paraferrimonas sedimenticola]GLP95720.1 peptidase S46 [Paraferrimonas sedimenticola]
MRKALSAASLMMLMGLAQANEGQWQPYQMPQIADKLKQSGISIAAEDLADLTQYPMNAVVGLGYCTASFVSPKGLVVTNHHCAYRAIQYNSRKQHNYMRDGFLANTMGAEVHAGPSERLYVTESVTDVSDKVRSNLPEDPLLRYRALEDNRKALIAECEADENYRCSVPSFHSGLEYYLIKQLIIRDVRLVYAPPKSVGAFGGDIDNYEYPRHAGDFTFLRAYVGKDGKPAAYSEDNVPYVPKSYLKVNAKGVSAGDGVLVAGYPGATQRYRRASELKFSKEWLYPTQAARYQRQLDTIAEMSKDNEEVAIKYAGSVASMANRMKKLNGLMDGFRATDIVGIKQQQQAEFAKWAQKDHADVLVEVEKLEQLLAQKRDRQQTDHYFENAQSSALLKTAMNLYRWALEKQKPDAERELGFQQRDQKMFTARLKRLDTSFDAKVDKALWQMDIEAYLAQDHRVPEFDALLEENTEVPLGERLEALYALSSLRDQQARLDWMNKDVAEFESSADPFIRAAVSLYPVIEKQERLEKTLWGELSKARPAYMKAIIAFNKEQGKPVYPDANRTLRISYGTVDGYRSADALYKQPFTKLEGIVAKHKGQEPFNAPSRLLEVIAKGDMGEHKVEQVYPNRQSWMCRFISCNDAQPSFNSVPVNFLSSVDTTGGNSGSPILNGKGELVGLNFDSTYEAITKDWFFNEEITRAIHVDIRYILWMMDKVDNAHNLLDELELVK